MPLSPSPPVPPPRRRRRRRRRRRCRHRRHRPARCRHIAAITAAAVADTAATVALFLAGAAVAATVAEAHRSPPPPLPEGYYTADWGFLLTDVVCVDPGGALDFALNAPPPRCESPTRPLLAPRHPCVRAAFAPCCPSLCAALRVASLLAPWVPPFAPLLMRGCRPFACQGVARLQRGHRRLHAARPSCSMCPQGGRLLEMNLMAAPQVADNIMHGRRQIHAGTCSS